MTAMALLLLLLLVVTVQLLSSPAACSSSASGYYCDWCPRRSTASLLPPDAGLSGACGYGSATAAEIDGGYYIAAASAEFFRGGEACGACYQLRCRDQRLCGEDGVKVMVTDMVPETETTTNRTGGARRFLLTRDAFTAMLANDAVPSHDDDHLASLDTVDVDFRRITCEYKNNLAVRVEETSSRERGHLAVRFLYQGGQTDIAAVEIAQAAGANANATATPSTSTTWQYMTRREGAAVWRTSRAPAGPLRLRIVVTAGSGGKWLQADGEVLPAEWQPGGVYDTGLRVTDVAMRTCGGACCGARDRRRGGRGAQMTKLEE